MKTTRITRAEYPFLLQQIPRLPNHMDMAGTLPPDDYKFLCVVGARKHTSYGKEACEHLITGLRGYPIVIVSGLAYGIDSLAHEVALEVGLKTIAFPGSGLSESVLYPLKHLALAKRIVESGGALLSPFSENQIGTIWTFPLRNRLMAGMSHATLVVEARHDSGTLLTAGHAAEFNRDVLSVPGSIFSDLSDGSNQLIRDGATAVTSSEDILEMLGFEVPEKFRGDGIASNGHQQNLARLSLSVEEKRVLEFITFPIEKDDLIRQLEISPAQMNSILANLELKGLVVEREGRLTIN